MAKAALDADEEYTSDVLRVMATHVRPVDSTDVHQLVEALIKAYEECAARGYISQEHARDSIEFIQSAKDMQFPPV